MSATPSQGTYDPLTGIWSVGTVNTSLPQTLVILAQVASPSPLTNSVTITHADQFDPIVANNAAAVLETPQLANLVLSKTVDNPTPNVGDTISFTVTLSNGGPDVATNVQVTDVLPVGLSFVSDTTSQGDYDPTTGLWSVGTVNTADAQTLVIRALVLGPSALRSIPPISGNDRRMLRRALFRRKRTRRRSPTPTSSTPTPGISRPRPPRLRSRRTSFFPRT